MGKTVFVHVDIDSPRTLADFWGLPSRGPEGLDAFYRIAMERALSLFKECDVRATFFCVGRELKESAPAARLIREASASGHEIANHTFSHPFGLAALPADEAAFEISQCSQVIEETTGKRPMGFRAPSYDIGPTILELLEKMGFSYDSSAFFSSLNVFLGFYHGFFRKKEVSNGFRADFRSTPSVPYYPRPEDCAAEGPPRRILEIPMPATRFLRLPFYNNFHLSTGEAYRRFALSRMNQVCFPYLFHLIEFCGIEDGIREDLAVHPNLRMPAREKLKRMRDSIRILKQKYRLARTDEFAASYRQ